MGGRRRSGAFVAVVVAIGMVTTPLAVANVGTFTTDEPTPMCGPAPAKGCEAWRSTHPGFRSEAVDVSPDGTLVATAGSTPIHHSNERFGLGNYDDDLVVQVHNAQTGATLWRAVYGTTAADEEGHDVVVGPDNERVYVALEGAQQPAVVAYHAKTGVVLWNATFGQGPDGGSAREVTLTPDGETVLAGGLTLDADDFVPIAALVAFDAETGERRWNETVPTRPHYFSPRIPSIGVTPDGERSFLATRGLSSHCGCDHVLVGLDMSTGQRLWTHEAGFGYSDRVHPVDVEVPNASQVVVGVDEDYPEIWAFDADTGDQVLHEGLYSYGQHYLKDLELASGGDDVYLGVRELGEGLGVLAYDRPNRSVAWTQDYTPRGYTGSLELSPDETTLYLAGPADGTGLDANGVKVLDGGADFLTVAADADGGEPIWKARYDTFPQEFLFALSSDLPADLATSPLGTKVFVTGYPGLPTPTVGYHAVGPQAQDALGAAPSGGG